MDSEKKLLQAFEEWFGINIEKLAPASKTSITSISGYAFYLVFKAGWEAAMKEKDDN